MKTLLRISSIACMLALVIASCSPEKRLARLVKHHPELVKTDTIFRIDTTVVNGVSHDTVFRTQITRDTLIIKDKQLTIKYYNDGTTTYLKGVCDTVRIIKEVPVIVNQTQPVETALPWWIWAAGILWVITYISYLRIVYRKK